VKNNFLSYIHNYRGFAILLIVGVHCRTSLAWPERSFIHELLIFGLDSSTILFVFISGYLFQYLNSEKLNYRDYLFKKMRYVMLPYILVSIPAILDKLLFETDAYWMSPFYKSLPIPFQIVYMLLSGKHSGPFYFIPMISIIFILAPMLFWIQKSRYFSITAFVIIGAGLFTYAYGYYGTIFESLLYFLPVYIFGMWASKNRELLTHMNYAALLTLTVGYLILFYLEMTHFVAVQHLNFFEVNPHYFTTQFNWSKLKEMMLALILLRLFYQIRSKNLRFLSILGSFSFGIYFVHIYFINVGELVMNYLQTSRMQSGTGYIIFTTAIVFLSWATVYLVKRIFKANSRLLIGS
jgi:probable poly-beta-1,6-N-acetyl-D-glucosamine export protein